MDAMETGSTSPAGRRRPVPESLFGGRLKEDGGALSGLVAPRGADVIWTTPADLAGRLGTVALTDGTAAYLNGERSLLRAARDLLVGRGVPAERIAVKPYWRRDQPNAGHGEPAGFTRPSQMSRSSAGLPFIGSTRAMARPRSVTTSS
jgi:hypothetical protein